MTTFYHEWRLHAKFLRRWLLGILLTVGFFMSFFPAFEMGWEELESMLAGFPPEVLQGSGLDADTFGTFSGYLAYIYMFVQLFLGVFAVLSGMLLIGREKLNRASDFLLSKPVSRANLWKQKIFVGILGIAIVNTCVALLVYIVSRMQHQPFDSSTRRILLASLIVQLILFLLGAFLAAFRKRLRSATGAANSIGFGLYFLLIVARLLEEEKLMKLSIFGLFDTTVVQSEGLGGRNLLLALGLGLVLAGWGCLAYVREDVEA